MSARFEKSQTCRFLAVVVLVAAACLAGCHNAGPPRDAFRWGADPEGGGPYVFPEDSDPTQVVGFEVDLAQALGRELNLRADFVHCTWDQMLPLLDRGNIDLALNGYEFTPERAERYIPSLPYYIYELGLCVRRDDSRLHGWNSLRQPAADGEKWRVGVLEASAADRYVSEHFAETCVPVRYQGATEALYLVETEQLDATVQDLPALTFYLERLQRYPALVVSDRPAAPGYYVIYAAPHERPLVDRINSVLRELYQRGDLRKIYEKYGLWNEAQQRLPDVWKEWHSELAPPAHSKWFELAHQAPLLLKAAGVTVMLSVLSMPLAILIGLSMALARAWGTPLLAGGDHQSWPLRLVQSAATLYVEIIRGTPLAFQLFVVYFILPEIGVRIHEFWAGVIALAVNYSAYEAEIFRLGLQAIPRGQMEAALSLGMSRALAVRRIILPQAWRLVIPASANDFIALFKDTAVCSVIAVEELSKQYSMGAKSTGLFLEMAALASILYLCMSYPLSLLSAWLERRLRH
ncbi:MAG: ABC transporter permease subunit [Planctomycetaceae bacterium]